MTVFGVHIKRPVKGAYYFWVAVFLLLTIVMVGGWLNKWMTDPLTMRLLPEPRQTSLSPGDQMAEIFSKAVQHMQSGEFDQSVKLWHAAMLINPDIPEVKVNMGFSLYETGEYKSAREFFLSAIDQNAFQANAYYGLAICSDQLGDLEAAMGAMKSYIHLAQPQDASFIRKARSAVWEWESSLKSKRVQKEQTQSD